MIENSLIERHNWTFNCRTQYFSHHPFLSKQKGCFVNSQHHCRVSYLFPLYFRIRDTVTIQWQPRKSGGPEIPRFAFLPYFLMFIFRLILIIIELVNGIGSNILVLRIAPLWKGRSMESSIEFVWRFWMLQNLFVLYEFRRIRFF